VRIAETWSLHGMTTAPGTCASTTVLEACLATSRMRRLAPLSRFRSARSEASPLVVAATTIVTSACMAAATAASTSSVVDSITAMPAAAARRLRPASPATTCPLPPPE